MLNFVTKAEEIYAKLYIGDRLSECLLSGLGSVQMNPDIEFLLYCTRGGVYFHCPYELIIIHFHTHMLELHA